MNALESDYQERVRDTGPARLLPGTSIEILRDVRPNPPPEHVLFDFDGTLSLIREGWPEVMIPMMVDILRDTSARESVEDLTRLVSGFVAELTGKQTVYQMIRLAEEVQKRGRTPEAPLVYKRMYHDRLMQRIHDRREALRMGRVAPEEMLVPYSLPLLEALRKRRLRLYLASGTDEHYVKEEARLLGLDRYFGDHVYGAVDDYRNFSKQMVIERILGENRVDGRLLLGFGDGYVEIDNVKTAGGTAVGVASDEAARSGKPDPWKRKRLISVGADVVIPDYRDHEILLDCLLGKGGTRQ